MPEDGVVSLPLEPIAVWLASAHPPHDFQIVIRARCDPGGVWATKTITSEFGAAAPPVTTDPDPAPVEVPGTVAPEESEASSPDRAASLAETGHDDSGVGRSVAAGIILVLVGSVFLMDGNRRAHQV